MQHNIKEVELNTNVARNPAAAAHCYRAAVNASANAVYDHRSFFNQDHLDRVRKAADIVNKFFTVKEAVYVNHRANGGKPFSSVKVNKLGNWPTSKNKQTELYAPLAALGCYEVVTSRTSNSMLFRIR